MTSDHEVASPSDLGLSEAEIFRGRLRFLGLSQADLRHFIEALSGHELNPTTTHRWATGARSVPPAITALIHLINDPNPLLDLRKRLESQRKKEDRK